MRMHIPPLAVQRALGGCSAGLVHGSIPHPWAMDRNWCTAAQYAAAHDNLRRNGHLHCSACTGLLHRFLGCIVPQRLRPWPNRRLWPGKATSMYKYGQEDEAKKIERIHSPGRHHVGTSTPTLCRSAIDGLLTLHRLQAPLYHFLSAAFTTYPLHGITFQHTVSGLHVLPCT